MNSTAARIYFDHAATTPVHPHAVQAMQKYLRESFHNPSGITKPAQSVRNDVQKARCEIAAAINAGPHEIFFTSGGTESINWALQGAMDAGPGHIITAATEHHAVISTCKFLQARGHSVTFLPVDSAGVVDCAALARAIRDDTRLVTIAAANNEIGTITPLAKIAEITAARGIALHTDAVQAVGHIPVDVAAWGVDMLSLSAHKFGGPKGVGALYIKKGTSISPLIHGGNQENKHRAGTENVIGIIGMAAALSAAVQNMPQSMVAQSALRDYLIEQIMARIPHTALNGCTGAARLPGNVNMRIAFAEGEAIVQNLDLMGFCASTGSACASGALEASHVLLALGLSQAQANSCVRFSLGQSTTKQDADALVCALVTTVQRMRDASPLYDDFLEKAETANGL